MLALARFVAQRGLLKATVWTTTKVSVRGTDRLTGLSAPFVLVANHSSHLDAPLVVCGIPRRLGRYLAVGAAADYFFERTSRRRLTTLFFNAFPIDRRGERRSPGLARSLLGRGIPILLFPEGGRSASGGVGDFLPGAAAIAIACGAPVVPIALTGTAAAMPRGTSWPMRGRLPITIEFGAGLRAAQGESAEDLMRRARDEIIRMHDDATARAAESQKGR